MTTIAYLVHDTGDPAVARRVRMFQAGGAQVAVAGFHRRSPPETLSGAPVTDLGRTIDAGMVDRATAVLRHLARPGRVKGHVARADVVVARNMEMLAIAARCARPGQRIVYECLDIHRLMTASGVVGGIMRRLERMLLRRVELIVTSSPAFEQRHFRERQGYAGPVLLAENKVLALDGDAALPPVTRKSSARARRIGWFGMLRCRKSLAMLRSLVERGDGAIEVLIAGIPSHAEFEDFERDVADVPGLRFTGRYTAADLPDLYGAVDFAWAIDYFEEGQNSTWLLPNRLYESLAFGAVPIAIHGVETARWLERHDVGIVVDDPVAALGTMLPALSDDALAAQVAAVEALPRDLLVATTADCIALTQAVAGRPA